MLSPTSSCSSTEAIPPPASSSALADGFLAAGLVAAHGLGATGARSFLLVALALSVLRLEPGPQTAVAWTYAALDLLVGGRQAFTEAGSWALGRTLLAVGNAANRREIRQGVRDGLTVSFGRSYAMFELERLL